MQVFLNHKIMNILTFLLTILCVTSSGCTGLIGDPPAVNTNLKITFELPEEWEDLQKSSARQRTSWSAAALAPWQKAYLDAGDNMEWYWKFSMVELNGAQDDTYLGATPKEKAEQYYQRMVEECRPDFYNCTVEPIHEIDDAGIKTYAFSDNNNGWIGDDYWETSFFFEKDGVMFKMGVRDRFEEEITQKTFRKVVDTLKIWR